jgi:hypothetical protein
MRCLPRVLSLCLVVLWAVLPKWSAGKEPSGSVKKKGIGLSEKYGFGAEHISALNVGWFYSQNLKPQTYRAARPKGSAF